MELRHLRYFVAVAEELHFGRAALRLGIAQPPLSQQIRRLEGELQTELLRRTRRRVELTEPGRVFLDEARATLAQADRAVRLAQRASRGEIGELSIGFVPWADFTDLPRMIRTFGERHPMVEVELHSLTVSEQLLALGAGRIDVGIVRPPVSSADLATEPLLSERLIVVFAQGHRFEALPRIPWRQLASEPYIAFSAKRASAFDAVIAQGCREAGITLKVRHEVEHPQTVLALVEAGIGVSLVPASFAAAGRPGITHRSLRPSGPVLNTIIAWRRENGSPLVEAFLRVVREMKGAPSRRSRPKPTTSTRQR